MRFERLRDNRAFRPEASTLETVVRFTNDYHLLRHFVHLHHAWIVRAEYIDIKTLLGIHVYEDARFVEQLGLRLRELSPTADVPYIPSSAVLDILEFLDSLETWTEYVAVLYSVFKPGLIDTWEQHFTTTDPVLDEPSTRLIAELMHVTSQHISGGMVVVESIHQKMKGHSEAVTIAVNEARKLWAKLVPGHRDQHPEPSYLPKFLVKESVTIPARGTSIRVEERIDTVELAEAAKELASLPESDVSGFTSRVLHTWMSEELQRAELFAELSHSNPAYPEEFHTQMARLVWDRVRHVRALEKILETQGHGWGHRPIDLLLFGECPLKRTMNAITYIRKGIQLPDMEAFYTNLSLLRKTGYDQLALLMDYMRQDNEYMQEACDSLFATLNQASASKTG